MSTPDRAPSTAWTLRADPGCGHVSTLPDDQIAVVLPLNPATIERHMTILSRKDARLLAKRINQCLDETRR